MATSGTTVFELSRDNIISAALRKLGVLAQGNSPTTEDLTNGMQALNALILEYQTLGMPLWKRTQYSLALVANTMTYTIGIGQTTNIAFPLKIEGAVIRDSGSAQIVNQISRDQFNLLNTSSTGKPVQFTYQPYINYGVLKVWPSPDTSYTMEITYQSPIESFSSAAETPDFPQEWQNALIYGLANSLAPEYGVPLNDRGWLAKEMEKHLEVAQNFGYENASLFIQVNRDF